MAKAKGNFSHLTDQDYYWDGVDEDSKRYGIESFKQEIKSEIHNERKRYRGFIEDTSDDYILEIMRGKVNRII